VKEGDEPRCLFKTNGGDISDDWKDFKQLGLFKMFHFWPLNFEGSFNIGLTLN
jgi:hypothetical protein